MKMLKLEIPHDDFKGERAKLRKFVSTYRDLPILWDVKCLDYTKKDKRNRAYEVLLEVYRTIKEDATIEDVKKKINSMRSNFRKELKKVAESANAGMEYRPSSWMYEELMFLRDLETHLHWAKSQFVASEENEFVHNSEANRVETDVFPNYPQYSNKRPRYSETKQNQQNEPQHIVDSMCANERDIARVWASKLKNLDIMQRLFAEKAINDVLFEAQLGTLHRNSVKINEYHMTAVVNSPMHRDYHQRYEPSQSSPEYKYSDTEVFRADDN